MYTIVRMYCTVVNSVTFKIASIEYDNMSRFLENNKNGKNCHTHLLDPFMQFFGLMRCSYSDQIS